MGEPYPSARERMKLANAGETKLSNKFVQLKKENNSEAKKKGRETTPQRQNDKTVETDRIEAPQGRLTGERKDRLIFRQAGEEIPPHQYDTGVHDSRQVPCLEQRRNNVEAKSKEVPCSSITRNYRCEPVAKKIKQADGNKDCLPFRTSASVETGQGQCFKIEVLW